MADTTSAASAKRQRVDTTNGSDEDGGDSIVGIDCGGKVFFTHKSTLIAGSAYFAARFGGSFSAGACRKDEYGRDVYFVDADSDTFQCILSYLRRGIVSWPKWADDPAFHKRLVAEAEYFGLDTAVMDKLKCVASIKYDPNKKDGKGIFYWLGTRYGKAKYENPYDIDKVSFSGYNEQPHSYNDIDVHKRKFIQFRPKCDVRDGIDCSCRLLWCSGAKNGDELIIKLTTIAVRPTHYSLRYAECSGMSDWNFEASFDGKKWDLLHEARDDPHIMKPTDKESALRIIEALATGDENESVVERCTGYAEKKLRHTWEVKSSPSSFYRFFRIIGPGEVEVLVGSGNTCLHGVGFELYGDVQALHKD